MAAFFGASPGVSRVVTRRMDYPLRGGWYTRRLYNHGVQAVVAISEGVRAVLIESGVDASRIHLVASGVEPDLFTPSTTTRAAARVRYGVADDMRLVVVVGALEERKGHAVLLDALSMLADPRLRVLCAGEGAARAALEARRAALGLDDTVRFLGRVDDIATLLAAADLMVMPSHQEGLGVAALEAMAAGVPVIASRVGGLPEAVQDGETGILVPPGDAAALALAIARLAADRTLARCLGDRGAARVHERFTMAGMANATQALYHRLAGVTPARGGG
jgi:glycosyltransferase involved in cell wall biosynthesis